MILEIDNVELYFKNKRILNGIYLKAETGKVTGILGRNGTGKSSLMDIIFGNLNSKHKLIRIDNTPVLKPLYKLKLVSYLPQYNFIPKDLKLKTVFRLFNVEWNNFTEYFMELSPYYNYKIGKLSSGERRCVEIFIILMSKKHIILLDEPFNGISPVMIERIKKLILKIKKEKIIILSDHIYRDVLDLTDTLYLIKNGSSVSITEIYELEDYGYISAID